MTTPKFTLAKLNGLLPLMTHLETRIETKETGKWSSTITLKKRLTKCSEIYLTYRAESLQPNFIPFCLCSTSPVLLCCCFSVHKGCTSNSTAPCDPLTLSNSNFFLCPPGLLWLCQIQFGLLHGVIWGKSFIVVYSPDKSNSPSLWWHYLMTSRQKDENVAWQHGHYLCYVLTTGSFSLGKQYFPILFFFFFILHPFPMIKVILQFFSIYNSVEIVREPQNTLIHQNS